MTLLVTVGSTLFPALTDAVLSTPTLDLLPALGYTSLVVQLGRADVPPALGARLPGLPGECLWDGGGGGAAAEGGGGGSSSVATAPAAASRARGGAAGAGLRVRVLRYTDDLDGEIAAAEAVVAHAGSGTILGVLRRGKRLLVVPNTALMDDHQRELADALGGDGYLDVCMVEDLHAGLARLADDRPRRPFPAQQSTFRDILDEVAGYA